MRRFVIFAISMIFWGAINSLWLIAKAEAQIDFFTFFIPYPTDMLDDQFDVGHAALNLINADIETTISISVHRDETVIYYDHWEDGLELTLTAPAQPSTEIWGDNDPTNGIPPNFAADILTAGDVIILRRVIPLPRNPADLFPDGGDKLTALGGALAITLVVWPLDTPTNPGILYAGAWELYPTSRWGVEYRIPVGQDLAVQRPGFSVVGINVQAAQDDTLVQFDLDADGVFEMTQTLDQGQQFTQVDGVTLGAHVVASRPVQVNVLTANPASQYEARAYSIIPFDRWSNELLAPRSADGNFWLYNPHDTPLMVTVQTVTTTASLDIPAKNTASYPPTGLSQPTAAHFLANDGRPFYGVAALDAQDAQEWGYTLLPSNALTTQTFVGLGIGNNNPIPDGDESRIYVTALSATTIYADFDNDGAADASFPVGPLQEVEVIDPDHDLTGAFLYTEDGVPFVSVWGQDEASPPSLPSIDVGTSIVPFPSLLIQKTVNPLARDNDCTATTSLGDIMRYRLDYFNNSVNPVENVIIEDNLPADISYIPNSTIFNDNSIPDDGGGSTSFLFDEGGYNIGSVPAREKGYVAFDVKIESLITSITNRAEIRLNDPVAKADTAIIFTPILTNTNSIYQIDASLIDPAAGVAASGDIITFSLTITNTSSLSITRFALRDIFDDNHLTFDQAIPAPNTVSPGVLEWNDLTETLGDLPAGQSFSLTIRFIVGDIPPTLAETTTEAFSLGGEFSDGTRLPPCGDEATVPFGGQDPTPTPTLTTTPEASGTPTLTTTPEETTTPNPTTSPTTTPATPSTTPTQPPDDDDDGCCQPGSTPTPPPPQATPAGTPVASANPAPPVLPVVSLPETGYPAGRSAGWWPLLWGVILGAGLLGWRIVAKRED